MAVLELHGHGSQVSDLGLTGEAAVLASKIRSVDRELDAIEGDRERSIALGMAATGVASAMVKWGQETADVKEQQLLAERAELVRRLRGLLGDD